MIVPTIHPNGTSAERLIESLCEASQALDLAYSVLKQTAPNGRDYQNQDEMLAAQVEHMSRLHRIDSVRNELDALTCAIAKAREQD